MHTIQPGKLYIANSHYNEFPDVLVTLELCRTCARLEGRKIVASLQACALALMARVENEALRNTLETMSTSRFPESQITRIRGCISRMESVAGRKLNEIKRMNVR
ncbi:hypothetical protein ACK6TD_19260 [Enterobacter hormaechei]|uniref:DUF7740 domain-containing protein n=1 Tax=Enterobacter hormaechei TaxID=158836 RepID=UPI003C2B6CF4